jgi:YVTN family beta-propeller protein
MSSTSARFLFILLIAVSNIVPSGHSQGAAARRAARLVPGPTGPGRVRLPNGWFLSPAGKQIGVGDFPLGLAVSPNGEFAAVVHSGSRAKGLDLVDLRAGRHVQNQPLDETWLGVAFTDGGARLAVATGHSNRVLFFPVDTAAGRLGVPDTVALGPAWSGGGLYPQGVPVPPRPDAIWPTGLAADDARGRLFAVSRLDSALTRMGTRTLLVERRLSLGAVPYTALVSRDGKRVYVSLWSSASVAVVDADSLTLLHTIAVGTHPTDLAESPDGLRVFVANANENTVSVVDVAKARTVELLRTSRTPLEPDGDTPNGLALDGLGERLYVANAGGNHVAVFDVAKPGHSQALGFLPVGWYPTAVRIQPGSGVLVVANGKGAGSAPSSAADADTSAWCRYIMFSPSARGTLSLIRAPSAALLARLTRQVGANTPPVRARRSGRVVSPIQHVFYIIKENRSYDQLLGDLPLGNGDSSLCLFGRKVTPNQHALANEFVLLDNTYCDSDGSADGHNWGMGAYATDYVIKGQPSNRIYDFEGGNPLAYPRVGYLWDLCRRQGISYRSYGEFVFNGATPADTVRPALDGLAGHVAPHYRGYDMTYSDLDRYRAWLEEFDRYDREGGLPQLSIIRLPNDHTEGTCAGRPTPRAHVAENDLALGLMVERISRSRYWPGALVLVIEDDAANGQDHVDAHRTVALAAGPYVKRAVVDSRLYTSCSVLRCIEDVFALPPMSQFDARANGLDGIFRVTPNLTPYRHREAQTDLDETNLAGAYGQVESDAMDFSVADVVPYEALNRILWHSVRGPDAPPPPPVRSGFALGMRRTPPPGADDDD